VVDAILEAGAFSMIPFSRELEGWLSQYGYNFGDGES
jgi:hypothetical protein